MESSGRCVSYSPAVGTTSTITSSECAWSEANALELLEVLAGIAPSELMQAAESGEVFTTGSWYSASGAQ